MTFILGMGSLQCQPLAWLMATDSRILLSSSQGLEVNKGKGECELQEASASEQDLGKQCGSDLQDKAHRVAPQESWHKEFLQCVKLKITFRESLCFVPYRLHSLMWMGP